MIKGTTVHEAIESSIFSELTLWKVIETANGRPVITHTDGSVSAIVPFSGINNTDMNESRFEEMHKGIVKVLNDLPTGVVSVQFVMARTTQTDPVDTSKLPSYLKPRADFFNTLSERYQLFKNEFYLSIHVSSPATPKKALVKDAILSLFKAKQDGGAYMEKAQEGINSRVEVLFEAMDAMHSLLSGMGGTPVIINSKKSYYDLLQRFTRPSKSAEGLVEIDDKIESPRQALFSGVRSRVGIADFTMDDYFHKVFTLDRAPKEYIFGKTIDVIESVPCEFIYSVTFKILPHQESMQTLKMKLAERRMAAGANESAIIEDRALMAQERKVSRSYDQFADEEGVGCLVSSNFVLRIKESFIETAIREMRLTRDEVLRKYFHLLQRKVFPRFGGSEWVCEDATGWMVFNRLIPGFSNMNSAVLKSQFLMTDNIPYFFPLYDNARKLDHNGTNHFIDERGNYVVFDLMDPSLSAWNYSISGQTGSGKSVLMNAIMTMQFADTVNGKRPVICILDVGGDRGSYTKFMNLVKGESINLSGLKKPSIQMLELAAERAMPTPEKVDQIAKMLAGANAISEGFETKVRVYYQELLGQDVEKFKDSDRKALFSSCFGQPETEAIRQALVLKPGECEPSQRQMNLILALLSTILSYSGGGERQSQGFGGFDPDEISEMVRRTYRGTPGRYPALTDLYKMTSTMVDPNKDGSTRLLLKLKNWTREGTYPMFDLETDVDLKNDVILVDMKGLEAEPQLQLMYTLLFSELMNNKMYFTRDRRKLIVRDEAWSILQNDKARRYFIEDLRTARKAGFATITLTQLPTDYLKPDPQDGRVIISCFQVQIICKIDKQGDCDYIGQELTLENEVVNRMKTLGVQKELQADGSYRALYATFMMIMGQSIYVLKNILHPFEYQLYSSSAEDNAVIDYYMKQTKQFDNLETTLWYLSESRHIGDKALVAYLEDCGYKNMAKKVRGK